VLITLSDTANLSRLYVLHPQKGTSYSQQCDGQYQLWANGSVHDSFLDAVGAETAFFSTPAPLLRV